MKLGTPYILCYSRSHLDRIRSFGSLIRLSFWLQRVYYVCRMEIDVRMKIDVRMITIQPLTDTDSVRLYCFLQTLTLRLRCLFQSAESILLRRFRR